MCVCAFGTRLVGFYVKILCLRVTGLRTPGARLGPGVLPLGKGRTAGICKC